MADFKEVQRNYLQAKTAYKKAYSDHYLAQQQLELAVQKQTADPALQDLKQRITELQQNLHAASDNLMAARKALDAQGSATTIMQNFNDALPILLLPLKLQTRYCIVKHVARNVNSELFIDAAKVTPSQKREIDFIFPHLRPLNDPFGSLGSPAHLLSNKGGAARRIIAEVNQPVNTRIPKSRLQKQEDSLELWVRIFPDDVFLQTHETTLTEIERDAGKIFWQSMWIAERESRLITGGNADSKKEKQLNAWRLLRTTCLPYRAPYVAKVMRPPDFPDNLPVTMETLPDNMFPAMQVKSASWTQPPFTELLPDRFIIKLFFTNPDLGTHEIVGNPIPDFLQLGFDPAEEDENAFSDAGKVMSLPPQIRWLTDLDEAEKVGMAVRIPLKPLEYVSGISKIVVLGIKTGTDRSEAATLLEKLFDNHHYRPDGLAFLAQGTPTNNLTGQPSGFNPGGTSDEQSFETTFKNTPKDAGTDSVRLASLLGVDSNVFQGIYNNELQDGKQALNVNAALWPATLGYYLDNHMRPHVSSGDINFAGTFFKSFVTGRGLLPSFRVGKQPYGVIPASAWSAWKTNADAAPSERKLVSFLSKMDKQWAKMAASVKTMKKAFAGTSEEQVRNDFREILSMQASSTRFFRRLVAGEYLLWNVNKSSIPLNTEKVGNTTDPVTYKNRLQSAEAWAEAVNPGPRILGKFFDNDNYKLTDLPADPGSDKMQMTGDGSNYLSLLTNASVAQLRDHSFGDQYQQLVSGRSSVLMFYTARFALLQGWIDAAINLLRIENPTISPLARLDFEMEYATVVNMISHEHAALLNSSGITGSFETRKNKWAFLDQVLTDNETAAMRIERKLKEVLKADDPVKPLQETLNALKSLQKLPTDKLERIMGEHMDICSFRLDAWLQGLALSRLTANRGRSGFELGVILGCFGYVESLVPGPDPLIRVKEVKQPVVVNPLEVGVENVALPIFNSADYTTEQLPGATTNLFVYLGSDPGVSLSEEAGTKKIIAHVASSTSTDRGFVLTPSLEHAATAGILRAGYEHHSLSQGEGSKTLAINLGSERTCWAMELLKGMQAGHSLNEQLGYFIERKMYEQATLAQFIPALRLAFPLRVEKNEWDDDQQLADDQKVKNLALVLDGLAIVNLNLPELAIANWPVSITNVITGDAKTAFKQVVALAADQFDAVSDLVISESVYQTVKGSPDRAAAALRMAGEGEGITMPEIVDIPLESRLLSHRVGYVFNAVVHDREWASADSTPSVFSKLSPSLNRWLADQLPHPSKIIISVVVEDLRTGAGQLPTAVVNPVVGDEPGVAVAAALGSNTELVKVAVSSLGLEPIDLYYLLHKSGMRPTQSLLGWFAMDFVKKSTPDGKRVTGFMYSRNNLIIAEEFPVNEIIPLVGTIGKLLLQSRPMRPADFTVITDNKQPAFGELYDNVGLLNNCRLFSGTESGNPLVSYKQQLAEAKLQLEKNFPVGFGSPGSDAAFALLIRTIPLAYYVGIWDAYPASEDRCDPINARLLIDQASNIMEQLDNRINKAEGLFTTLENVAGNITGDQQFEQLSQISKQLAGDDFLVLPGFRLPDTASVRAALNDTLVKTSIGESGLEEWLQSLAMVRDPMRYCQNLQNLRAVAGAPASDRQFRILQLPLSAGQHNQWIGVPFAAGFSPALHVTSMAYEFNVAPDAATLCSGIVVDDWREKVPLRKVTAGVSMKFNQSNAEAPQTLLLVTAPELKGSWDWLSVQNAVIETFALAKKRAVDSEIIQNTWLSQFLPAIVTPVDPKNNTPNLDFKLAGPAIKPIIVGPGPVDPVVLR